MLELNLSLSNLSLVDYTKPKSHAMGRGLYQFEFHQKTYWLKRQEPNQYDELQQSFARELKFYQDHPQLVLPHRIGVDPFLLDQQCLVIVDTNLWFDCCPQDLTLKQIRVKIETILDYLQKLYELGILHADLKHEHLRQHRGDFYLIDFEQHQNIYLEPSSNKLTATPRYMAPELFHGASKTIESEIYALGIILYEWLTGQRLQAKTYQEWGYLHCQRLKVELPEAYRELNTLIEGMLAKQKIHRSNNFLALKSLLNA